MPPNLALRQLIRPPMSSPVRRFRPLSTATVADPSPTPLPPAKRRTLLSIPRRRRGAYFAAAAVAVADYLHSNRGLPSSLADLIVAHSPRSLSQFLHSVSLPASAALLRAHLRRRLSFFPLPELDFFLESIGYNDPPPSPVPDFLSDDPRLIPAASSLYSFGFAWRHLGRLYPYPLLSHSPSRLTSLFPGLPRAVAVAAVLSFPSLLSSSTDPDAELLLGDLRVFFSSKAAAYAAGGSGGRRNDGTEQDDSEVEHYLSICEKIKAFYDFGAPPGSLGELLVANAGHIVAAAGESEIRGNLALLLSLGWRREKVIETVFTHGEVLALDLESLLIPVPRCLMFLGLTKEKIATIARKHQHLLGMNKFSNLPGILRATGVMDQFQEKMSVGDGSDVLNSLLEFICRESSPNSSDVPIVREFVKEMEKVKSNLEKLQNFDTKLEFLQSVGFSRNRRSVTTAQALHIINNDNLQKRFEHLLGFGIPYPMVCQIIAKQPKILNQSTEVTSEKLSFLLDELKYPLDYLDSFPAFLAFDLQNRIKPRFQILGWLQDLGLVTKPLSPATVVSVEEKRFMRYLYNYHPAAPKQWLECFSSRKIDGYYNQILFRPKPQSQSR